MYRPCVVGAVLVRGRRLVMQPTRSLSTFVTRWPSTKTQQVLKQRKKNHTSWLLPSVTIDRVIRPIRCFLSSAAFAAFAASNTATTTTTTTTTATTTTTCPPITKYDSIRIWYASQGGTAQLFALQLSEALEEAMAMEDTVHLSLQVDVHVAALNETNDPSQVLFREDSALHVFLTSTAGVGEPPDNGRDFYNYVVEKEQQKQISGDDQAVDFILFGLGNQKAHPNHYNVVAKTLYEQLTTAWQCNALLPLALGDDGDCLEDDFDQWQQQVIAYLFGNGASADDDAAADKVTNGSGVETSNERVAMAVCPGARGGKRRISPKYPMLALRAPESASQIVRSHLLDDPTTASFYPDRVQLWNVTANTCLNQDAVANGLMELQLRPSDGVSSINYQAGDHLLVLPRNSDSVVEAYLQHVLDDVDPNAVVVGSKETSGGASYPFPRGLTVFEKLSHCVDLSATPSPAFARSLLGPDIDYKQDIAKSRRTGLEVIQRSDKQLSLEDVLYSLQPLQGRYYSIASSELAHPDAIYLTYRPVQYMTSQGHLRRGLCTSYLSNLATGSTVVAALCSNPTFRLPENDAPIVMLAGGCGVAPIRAFLEERIYKVQRGNDPLRGEAYLFLGFRNPADKVYGDLIGQALETGALTETYITYTTGSRTDPPMLVSEAVRQHSQLLYDLLQTGAYMYVCGGARTFGVAIENELHGLLQRHGDLDDTEATAYMQQLIKTGRLNEDLAD